MAREGSGRPGRRRTTAGRARRGTTSARRTGAGRAAAARPDRRRREHEALRRARRRRSRPAGEQEPADELRRLLREPQERRDPRRSARPRAPASTPSRIEDGAATPAKAAIVGAAGSGPEPPCPGSRPEARGSGRAARAAARPSSPVAPASPWTEQERLALDRRRDSAEPSRASGSSTAIATVMAGQYPRETDGTLGDAGPLIPANNHEQAMSEPAERLAARAGFFVAATRR